MAFFDDLGKKLSQAGQGALQKTKEMADIARLNSLISDEEKLLNNSYYQIGKLFSELHANDCEECFSAYISAVNESLKKISVLKAEMQALRAVSNCPNCGAEVTSSSLFCNVCGAQLPNTVKNLQTESADSVKCSNCGSYVNKNMKFCTTCGTLMASEEQASAFSAEKVVSALKCPACGSDIEEGAAFCVECGAKLQ